MAVNPSTAGYLKLFANELKRRGFEQGLIDELVTIACAELCKDGLAVYGVGEDPQDNVSPIQ